MVSDTSPRAEFDFKTVIDSMSHDDLVLIGKIVQRSADTCKEMGMIPSDQGLGGDLLLCAMCITAVHGTSCPLKLWQWLHSSVSDFMSDLRGIVQHCDQGTGNLLHGYVPIFAADAVRAVQ